MQNVEGNVLNLLYTKESRRKLNLSLKPPQHVIVENKTIAIKCQRHFTAKPVHILSENVSKFTNHCMVAKPVYIHHIMNIAGWHSL